MKETMLRALSVLAFVGNVSLRMAFGGETLQTVSGHAYTNATVVRMDPLGVNIIHSKGSARVLFSDLPRVTADRLGYDPAKAAEFQKQIESQRQEMAHIALLQTQKVRVLGKVVRKTPDGIIVISKRPEPPPIQHDRMSRMGGSIGPQRSSVVEPKKGEPPVSEGTFLIVGHPREKSLVDNDEVTIVGYPAGKYQYTSALGALNTLQRLAVSPALALSLQSPESSKGEKQPGQRGQAVNNE